MKILGETIAVSSDYLDIYDLKFLKDNPRVYACTHSIPGFDNLPDTDQQQRIFDKLAKEASVKNLYPEIKRHQGLIEPILVRHDTMEVIEGNSRLAVYRMLNTRQSKGEDIEGDFELIPCQIVARLSEDQQAAFLNQIHVKGKTKWSAYEKANFAYVRHDAGWTVDKIANLFGESPATVKTRVNVIRMMRDNSDSERSHFSYYDVLARAKPIANGLQEDAQLESFILEKIKQLGKDENENEFTAQVMRKQLPVVLNKKKVLKQYVKGEISLEDAYQRAKISQEKEKVLQASKLLDDVSSPEVLNLGKNDFNAFKQAVRQLKRKVDRITKIVEKAEKTDSGND